MAKRKRMITKEAKQLQTRLNKDKAKREYLISRREVWNALRVHNDVQALADYCGVSRTAISNALNRPATEWLGSLELLTKIDEYFKTRENAKKD
jgi:hypothetical protein